MSTSGSVNFNLTRNEIIELAYQIINVYGQGDVLSPESYAFGSKLLNMMIKQWVSQGLHVWTKTEATLFLQLNQVSYNLNSSGDNATNSFVETTISVDELSGATNIDVDSTSGMTVGDYVGIELDSGSLQWTTISTIPTATNFTIPSGLTDTATTDNVVYAYTTKINRPLKVFSSRRNDANDLDTPMWLYSHQEYFDLPNKTNTGVPTSFYYDPQLTTGVMYVWPSPILVTDKVKFTYSRPIEDFDLATDTPDFPQEWLEPLAYQLAIRLSHRYGKRAQAQALKADADEMLQRVLEFDNEEGSIFFQPNFYGR